MISETTRYPRLGYLFGRFPNIYAHGRISSFRSLISGLSSSGLSGSLNKTLILLEDNISAAVQLLLNQRESSKVTAGLSSSLHSKLITSKSWITVYSALMKLSSTFKALFCSFSAGMQIVFHHRSSQLELFATSAK